MTELRNVEREVSRFRARLLAAAAGVLLLFVLLLARLVWLQVFKHDELSTQAEENRVSIVPIVPNRGLILDRNGIVLATNYSAYTLEITPSKVANLDATIDELSTLVDITPRDRRRFKKLLEDSKSFESLPIRTRLTDTEVARFAAQRFRFTGVDIRARLFRQYPLGEVASHVLGYIGRINPSEEDKIADSDDEANYRGTDYIGKLGIEQSYEKQLHGTTGFEEVEVSAGGRAVRKLAANKATPGDTLVLSLDIRLQKLVEDLYGNRRGALVAIDPRDGEVLAFVSKPTFDPNLFVDGIDNESWKELNDSIDKPLLNRALRGTYPPGSTYKPYMALAALTSGKRTPQQTIYDPGYFMFGNHKFRDDKEGGHGMVDMYRSLVDSCDTYYYMVAADLGVDAIAAYTAQFGFGSPTGIDLEGEARGVLPSTEWKKRNYRRPDQQRWYAGETISLGIGQGYNNYTVLQMAQAISTLSEGGERFRPHLVREIVDPVDGKPHRIAPQPLLPVPIKPQYLDVVRNALIGVNKEGTSALAFKGAPYVAAGKTGTAQVVGIKQNEKYNAAQMAEHLLDHALYVAYAPADHPTVALAMVVENAGFGAQAAAPIARKIFDYLLLGKMPTDQEIAAMNGGVLPVHLAALDGPAKPAAGAAVKAVPVPVAVQQPPTAIAASSASVPRNLR